jgi:hypothetical protein
VRFHDATVDHECATAEFSGHISSDFAGLPFAHGSDNNACDGIESDMTGEGGCK